MEEKDCRSSTSASTSRKMIKMRYKQTSKRSVEAALVVVQAGNLAELGIRKLQESSAGEGPIFGPPLCKIRAPGLWFRFRFRLLGYLVSITFWLRFLLRSRLVPVTSPEN